MLRWIADLESSEVEWIFGPFYVKPDEFETGYVISVDETPQSIETNPEGIFSHKNLRIARGQLED